MVDRDLPYHICLQNHEYVQIALCLPMDYICNQATHEGMCISLCVENQPDQWRPRINDQKYQSAEWRIYVCCLIVN